MATGRNGRPLIMQPCRTCVLACLQLVSSVSSLASGAWSLSYCLLTADGRVCCRGGQAATRRAPGRAAAGQALSRASSLMQTKPCTI